MRSTMVDARAAIVAAVALLGACAEPGAEPDPGASRAPIIGGQYTPNDDAVVGLVGRGGIECTGTLVTPRVVVSAAHCVIFGAPRQIFIGSDPAVGGRYVDVRESIAHPDFDVNELLADISAIILAEPVEDVPPVPLVERAPQVGEVARFVGFGLTRAGNPPGGDYGRKYEVRASIAEVRPLDFKYGVATCNGDSGGPAFLEIDGGEYLAGVTSWGDPDCAEYGWDTRVDAYLEWLKPVFDRADEPICASDGRCATGCPKVDPDCPCSSEDGFCDASCADLATDDDCPVECSDDGTCRKDGCPRRDSDCPITRVGDPCEHDFDCAEDALCDGVCRPRCGPGFGTCTDGQTCEWVDSSRAACTVPSDEDDGGWCRIAPARRSASTGHAGGPAALLPGLALLAAALARVRRR